MVVAEKIVTINSTKNGVWNNDNLKDYNFKSVTNPPHENFAFIITKYQQLKWYQSFGWQLDGLHTL